MRAVVLDIVGMKLQQFLRTLFRPDTGRLQEHFWYPLKPAALMEGHISEKGRNGGTKYPGPGT